MFPFGALGAQGHRESSGPKGDWKSWSEKTSAPAIAPRGRPFCESAQVHSTMFGRDAPGAKTVQNIRVISLKMASCRTCVATATKIDTRAARDVALVVDNVETLSAARRKWPVARAPAQRRNAPFDSLARRLRRARDRLGPGLAVRTRRRSGHAHDAPRLERERRARPGSLRSRRRAAASARARGDAGGERAARAADRAVRAVALRPTRGPVR